MSPPRGIRICTRCNKPRKMYLRWGAVCGTCRKKARAARRKSEGLLCSQPYCDRPVEYRSKPELDDPDICDSHYRQLGRHGRFLFPRHPDAAWERLMDLFEKYQEAEGDEEYQRIREELIVGMRRFTFSNIKRENTSKSVRQLMDSTLKTAEHR